MKTYEELEICFDSSEEKTTANDRPKYAEWNVFGNIYGWDARNSKWLKRKQGTTDGWVEVGN